MWDSVSPDPARRPAECTAAPMLDVTSRPVPTTENADPA